MPYSIMEALFDGRVIPWERKANLTCERLKIEEQIEREKQYFAQRLSADDCARFERLEELFGKAAHCEEVDTYAHGFTLGALLSAEVLMTKELLLKG